MLPLTSCSYKLGGNNYNPPFGCKHMINQTSPCRIWEENLQRYEKNACFPKSCERKFSKWERLALTFYKLTEIYSNYCRRGLSCVPMGNWNCHYYAEALGNLGQTTMGSNLSYWISEKNGYNFKMIVNGFIVLDDMAFDGFESTEMDDNWSWLVGY
jgi:hypothetical protein